MLPPLVPFGKPYRPRLKESGIAYAEVYKHQTALDHGWSAARALQQDPRRATPANMQLQTDDPAQFGDQNLAGALPWTPQRDLLASDRFAQEFVVETEADGSALLRFGDNRFGLQPDEGVHLLASYRQGGGAAGNVGSDSITRLVSEDTNIAPFVLAVRNPLPAQGGADPEIGRRCQAASARSLPHPGARGHRGRLRPHGRAPPAGPACIGPPALDGQLVHHVRQHRSQGRCAAGRRVPRADAGHLDRYRLAGYDLDLRDPAFVPLDIELGICVLPGYMAAAVKHSLLLRLSNGLDAQGQPAFFHPDHFSFGTGLALSALVEAAQAVTGVASVDVIRFQRWGRTPNKERDEGLIPAAPLEVLRLDNDPNFPENGRLTPHMRGGS